MTQTNRNSDEAILRELQRGQAELAKRQKERMLLASLREQPKSDDAANDNLLQGFQLLPKFRFLTDKQLGTYDWRCAWSGRGTGKSWQFADAAIFWAYHIPNLRVAFVRMKESDLELSSKALLPDRLKHWGLWGVVARWSNGKIIFDNGSEINFIGLWKGGTPDGVKSLEGVNLTVVEEAEELSLKALEALTPTVMRTPLSEIWAIWNPKKRGSAIDAKLRGNYTPERSVVQRITRSDNPHFPEKMARDMADDFRRSPARAAHIWDGDYEPEAEGAMWNQAIIDQAKALGEKLTKSLIKRVVIAVDPAGGGGDRVGIVAAASLNVTSPDGKPLYCVLGDYSMSAQSPSAWAKTVKTVCEGWNTDCVVYENNYGGNLVRSNLLLNGVSARIIEVHASKGKHLRAEPIAALYDNAQVWHRKDFPGLCEQMLYMLPSGYAIKGSPDALDAMVFALTELSGSNPPPRATAHGRK